MHHILALLQKAAEVSHIVGNIDLRGFCLRSRCHAGIKLLKGYALPQIVAVFHAVKGVAEAHIFDAAPFKMLLVKVCGGAAAKHIFIHRYILLA